MKGGHNMPSVRDTVHNTPSRVNTITAHPHLRVAREPDLCFVGEAVLPAELAGLGIGIVVFGAACNASYARDDREQHA